MALYTFSDQARALADSAARGNAYAALDRMEDMQAAIVKAARALRALYECGHSEPWLADAINGIKDQASNIQGECRADAESLLGGFTPLDLSEIDALLAEVKP